MSEANIMVWKKTSDEMPPVGALVLLYGIIRTDNDDETINYTESIRCGTYGKGKWYLHTDDGRLEVITIESDTFRVSRWSELNAPDVYDLRSEFENAMIKAIG